MERALSNLIDNPQNNLRIFCDGRKIYGDDQANNLDQLLAEFIDDNCNTSDANSSILVDLLVKALLLPVSDGSAFTLATQISQTCQYHACTLDAPQGMPTNRNHESAF